MIGARSELECYGEAESLIERVYELLDGSEAVESFCDRNEIGSMLILTVASHCAALAEVQKLREQIEGKTVIEIGAGVGMLALHMARYAKRVWAIESDPGWSWIFTKCLYEIKPPNLAWIFGRAQDFIDTLHADVAVVYTRSDIKGMGAIASRMAAQVIRGPLVETYERYGECFTPEQIAYVDQLVKEARLHVNDRRGIPPEDLRGIEAKLRERFA